MSKPANGRGKHWRTRTPTTRTLCPECGEVVYRSNPFRGKLRYYHRDSQRLACKWHGSDAIGFEEDAKSGVDRATSRRLKSEIIAARGSKVTYVITAAQNATPVWESGWRTLLAYCKHNKATLLVIPYRYHNPTSIWSAGARSSDRWAEELRPYLITDRVDINGNLTLLADIMAQPTASDPIEGFEAISSSRSAIIGHPRLELTTVPTPQSKLPKILTTTGAITRKNYIPSKQGKKGEFHHTFGACVVEVDGDSFHMRQLNMTRDGSFCDLLAEYDGDERRPYARIPALVMGDAHIEVADPAVMAATFEDEGSIVKVLKPQVLVWHDVFDGSSINHHDRGRTFHEYVKHHAKRRNAEAEVQRTLDFIDRVTPKATRNVFVASNHHDFLKEWVENTDPRRDPENVMFWAETYLAIVRSGNTQWTPAGVTVQDPFAYWGKKRLKTAAQATFLTRDETFQVKGIELGYHSDRGPGGQKGSRQSFRKIGVKTVIGHGHAPGIREGCYQVGTKAFLNLTYAAGTPSAWLHTDCAIYPNGKRSLINIVNGKWRGI